MSKQEFLLLIPAIIYGIAMVDLLKVFQHKKKYWESIFWGIFLMVVIIYIWTTLFQKLDAFASSNLNVFIITGQAITYALTAGVLTPEEKDLDSKIYFLENRRSFFSLFTLSVFMNFLVQLVVFDDNAGWIRLTFIPLLLLCVFVDQVRVRATVGAIMSLIAVWVLFVI